MRLIFLHGRDQQGKDGQALQETWTAALGQGLIAAHLPNNIQQHEVVFPYYGDDLAEMVKEIGNAAPAGVSTKGGELGAAGFDRVQMDLLQDMLAPASVNDETEAQVSEKGVQNTALARVIARAIDSSRFGPNVLQALTKDVSIYLTHEVVAKRINAIVAATIEKGPCIVVAHSLGSIIAYRVLRELGVEAQVRRLITVGSPLGLNTVRKMLSPPARTFPVGVTSWMNAYDSADIVALHALDGDTWPVKPAIKNFASVKNHTDNRHGIEGYLADSTVAHAIYEALNTQ